MTKSKHTPGPWHLSDPGYRPGHISTLRIYSSDARLITTLSDIDSEHKANARLIAAAPELLGALEAALDEVRAATTKARVAIAKATGEAS